jgi:phosphotriesterase-related protein
MRAVTVLGEIPAEALGFTLPHEHLNLDARFLCTDPTSDQAESEIDWDHVRERPMATRANLLMMDEETATDEVAQFRELGGGTLVDVTPEMTTSRDPLLLRRISLATNVNIIMGAGFYVDAAHPPWSRAMSADQIARRLCEELSRGIGELGIRPGVIGEIGIGDHMSPDEQKSLHAAAVAHVATGAPLSIHFAAGCREVMGALDVVQSVGATDLSRVIVCHMDNVIDLALQEAVIQRGAIVEFDTFGHEDYPDSRGVRLPSDDARIQALEALASRGHLEKLLLSQDLCLRSLWTKYGGGGYGHIQRAIVPRLRAAGFGDGALRTLFFDTPARVFAYVR